MALCSWNLEVRGMWGEKSHRVIRTLCVCAAAGGVGVMGGEMEAPRLTSGLYLDLLDVVH